MNASEMGSEDWWLLDELREVANKTKYQHMYYSTNIGVLEMLKMELYESIRA